MIENVTNSQDSYIKSYIAKLPQIEKGETRVIKRGDNLWNIAREKLGKKSKRSEINNYMMQIAKLNGFDTLNKMNNIDINTVIYLPKDIQTVTNPRQNIQQKTQAEKSFDNRLNAFMTKKDVQVKKALYMPELYNYLYHVTYNYLDDKGILHMDKPIMSVEISKTTKKLESISFEDDKNIYSYGYDYKIGKDNKIKSNNPLNNTEYGKITPEQRSKLERLLSKYI